MKNRWTKVTFRFLLPMAIICLPFIFAILINACIPFSYAFRSDNNLSSYQARIVKNSYLYDSCFLNFKKYDSLTIIISGEISKNNKSGFLFTMPLSACINFDNPRGDFDSFITENNDRAEVDSINLMLEAGQNISIILGNPERKKSSMFEVFLGCPVPTPPTYRDIWALLEFNRGNGNLLEFEIPEVTEDIEKFINKYEFGCTLVIREFTSDNTMWEFRYANTLID